MARTRSPSVTTGPPTLVRGKASRSLLSGAAQPSPTSSSLPSHPQSGPHPTPPPGAAGLLLTKATQGAGYIFLGTLAQRLLTFALNYAVLLHVASAEVGYSNVYLELLRVTALFVSREAARLTALRAPLSILQDATSSQASARVRWQQLVNLAWLPVPLALAFTGVYLGLRDFVVAPQGGGVVGAHPAFYVTCAAMVVEALAEPAYILTNTLMLYGARAGSETSATLLHSSVVYAMAVWGGRGGSLAFALGHLTTAIVHLVGFWWAVFGSGGLGWRAVLPTWGLSVGVGGWFGVQQAALLKNFFLQGLLKHALTQADKFVLILAKASNFEQQGEYNIVEQLGSLAPRLIFFPMEEALRGLVSKLLPAGGGRGEGGVSGTGAQGTAAVSVAAAEGGKPVGGGRRRRSPSNKGSSSSSSSSISSPAPTTPPSNIPLAVEVLAAVTHTVLIVGLLIACLGPVASPLLARLLPRFAPPSTVPHLLQGFSVYIAFLALNGVTEAFGTAAADGVRLKAANFHLLATALVGAALSAHFVPLYGVAAIIATNTAGAVLRTLSALSYTHLLVAREGLDAKRYIVRALPHPTTGVILGGMVVGGHAWVQYSAKGSAVIALAGVVGIAVVGLGGVVAIEGRRVKDMWALVRGGKRA